MTKLSKNPKLKELWAEMLAARRALTYDPFYEVWFYDAEEAATRTKSAASELDS